MRNFVHAFTQFIKERPVSFVLILFGIVLIAGNAYVLFEKDSAIERNYYIDEYKQVFSKNNEERIAKKAILAPLETYTVAADAEALSSISVKRGQEIMMNEELAIYKNDAQEKQQSLLESEIDAYSYELTELENVLDDLENEAYDSSSPTSYIDSSQVSDELNVSIKLELQQQTSIEGAIALITSNIAETERQLDILSARSMQIELNRAEISPIEGVVADISQENGTVTFTIYSNEKLLRTYVTENEWTQLQVSQMAELELKDRDEPVDATVVMKQSIMANGNSIWEQEFEKSAKLPDSTYYELELTPSEMLTELPFATMVDTSIIVNEAPNSYRVKKAWLKEVKVKAEKAVEPAETEEVIETPTDEANNVDEIQFDDGFLEEEAANGNGYDEEIDGTVDGEVDETTEEAAKYTTVSHLYSIGFDGRIRFEPVDIAFENDKDTIIVTPMDEGTPVLDDTKRTVYYRTFLMLPLERPEWKLLKDMTWKDYLKYLIS